MSTGLLTHVDLSGSMGALQIGSIVAVYIFGIVTLQAHIYYTTFPGDSWKYKTLVASVWLLELTHTIGVSYEVYRATIVLYGRPDLLTSFPVLGSMTGVGGAITLLVQTYFSLRLYKVLPKPWCHIGLACITVSTLRFAASVYLSVRAAQATSLANYRADQAWLISVLLTTGAVVDIVIAATMLQYLMKKREKGLQRMASVVDRLIAYTIRSGLLTSISAAVMLICFQAMPDNLVWLALYSFLAKLYSNSLLSALNARQTLRDEITNSMPSVDRFGTRSKGGLRRDGSVDPARFYNASQVISIEMKTTTETIQDDLKAGPSYHLEADQKI